MKAFPRKLTALLLAFSLLLSVAANASFALGDDLFQKETQLHNGVTLSTNTFWGNSVSNFREENFVTYTPSAAVTPVVSFGESVTALTKVSTTAASYGANHRVVAAINGDYFNTSNGTPIGLVVTDGSLRSGTQSYSYAVGFYPDGTAIMGKPTLTYSLNLGANSDGIEVIRAVRNVNKVRENGGIYLYTYDFNKARTSGTTAAGVEVLCDVVDGSIAMGKTATLAVNTVLETPATVMQENQVVLSCTAATDAYFTAALQNLTPGQTLTFTCSVDDPAWETVTHATGALYQLVKDGQVASGLDTTGNPRTAIGKKVDGTLIFYTMDGRRSGHSMGASQTQVAKRLIELGCVEAMCLDGGGSTTLAITKPGAVDPTVINVPSESSERAVSTQILLLASNTPTNTMGRMYVSADEEYVLAGKSVELSATAVDTNFMPLSVNHSLSADRGTLSGTTLDTSAGGDITVTASFGAWRDSVVVHAITTPDSIRVLKGGTSVSSLTLAPGESVSLSSEAIFRHKTLPADSSLFTWSASGNIGTITADGKFTAGNVPTSGTVTCSFGSVSKTVSVKVTANPLVTLETFETDSFLPTDSTAVHNGFGAGRMSYVLTDGSYILPMNYALPAGYDTLNLWVYGDASGNALSFASDTGSVSLPLDFAGWKQISLTLPASSTALLGVSIAGNTQNGTLYLDQMVASYLGVVDSEAPEVTMTLTGTTLTATLTDAVEGKVSKDNISLTYDGAPLTFTLSASTLTANLPAADGVSHRVSLVARDNSGNLVKTSLTVPALEGSAAPFTDSAGSAFAAEIAYLYHAGITKGYADGSFRPNNYISRQEFAVMLYRYLGLNDADYAAIPSAFADEASIGGFAKTAVTALSSMGVINGTEKNGKLYFNPQNLITRAQAAIILDRLLAVYVNKSGAVSTTTKGQVDAGMMCNIVAVHPETSASIK
ncbi:MAG: phosphodiester glycosidase family protein, partial [Oscillospiraceae bacterium]|nr:phosphodiester glycosidase family protein [Oscillospiraceae bacterium]